MNKTSLNIITSLFLQFVTIISGFIIPKLILTAFGSEVNGLISSINQFLGYIAILEGGITGVMMASLYKPLFEKNKQKISSIVSAMNNFYRKLGLILFIYSICLAAIYPFVVDSSFSWEYIFTLTLIISINMLVQYNFSITMKVLLNADRKVYYTSIVQSITVILNVVCTYFLIKYFPSIHIVKLVASIVFLIQPLSYHFYIKKHYDIDKTAKPDKSAISQRWDGFGINIASFIHNNTDLVVLSIFCDLKMVSVYSTYFLVITGLKAIITAISSGINPTIGRLIAKDDTKELNSFFDTYELGMELLVFFLFTAASLLIVPFVMIYTKNITDANYYQPLFAFIIVLAEEFFCIREPYVNIAYQANHFKGISKIAYIEAIINIVLSLILTPIFGIVGVAIGTLVAMLLRTVYQAYYLKNNIVYRDFKKFIKYLIVFFSTSIVVSIISINILNLQNYTILGWIFNAVIISIILIFSLVIVSILFFNKEFKSILKFITRKYNS